MIHSMTAFERGEREGSQGRLVVELRSVNHRYLDVSLRLPDTLRPFEPKLRDVLRKRLDRGKAELSARLSLGVSDPDLSVDEHRLDAIATLAEGIRTRFGASLGPADPLELLRWPGVLKEREPDQEALGAELEALFEEVLEAFIQHRAREGGRLAELIETRLTGIEDIVAEVRESAGTLVAALRARLAARVAELTTELDEGRLEQEVALLAQKADVAEELDRLEAHVAEFRRTLSADGPSGRRLDFLSQELNREANTLAAKASTAGVALRAVDLKVLIEQIREQIQNIE